jgi:hypothetical protein
MLIYWLMFLIPAGLALRESVRKQVLTDAWRAETFRFPGLWWLILLALTLLVGWRFQVGGDWGNYLRNFDRAFYLSGDLDWWLNDPGYRLLEYVSVQFGWGIYGVNLLAGALFSLGLVVFCRHLPRPWLALAVSIPYLVMILGMGYSRQGIALGLLMIGLVTLGRGEVTKFLVWAVIAATFHKSAVVLIPLAALAASQRRVFVVFWAVIVTGISYVVLLQDAVEGLRSGYIDAQYQSQGALVRLLMNALPAALLLWKRRRFETTIPKQKLYFWMAVIGVGLAVLSYYSPSSTAVDRMGLYILPLQLMVFSYLPEVLGKRRGNNTIWVLLVLAYYASVEFVWLNFATHAFAWIPYQFYPWLLFWQS